FSRSQSWSFLADGCPVVAGLDNCHVGSASDIKIGWAAGAGIEYGLTNNWTIRAEYLHLGFYRSSFATTNVGTAFVGITQSISHFQGNTDIDILRGAVNYRF